MTESSRRQTVATVSARWSNFLLNVPTVGYEVCEVCHGYVEPSYAACFGCKQARDTFGEGCADAVAAVSLAPRGSQMARNLVYYKHEATHPAERRRLWTGMAATLWRWLNEHEGCLARAAGARTERFDLITSIPSTRGRVGPHPLEVVVPQIVVGTTERYATLLTIDNSDVEQREFAVDRYRSTQALHGESVLIVDDTWTTGAHAQSAASALKAAGAGPVAVLAIGRWLTPEWKDTTGWLQRQRRDWDWARCCVGRH